jgi:hypothetical protein
MIRAAQPMLKFEAGRLCELLEESNRLLKPLADPFCTDFGAHRFWRHSNEMVYSDWLAWIVHEIGEPDVVLGLFGLGEADSNRKHQGGVLSAEREYEIPGGRLDVYILRRECPVALVEVKLGTPEDSDLTSLLIYKRWFENKLQSSANGRLVLLAGAGEKTHYDGFRLLTWSDLCLRLRTAARSLISNKKIMLAGVVLAFVGAVEQNLLEFSCDLVKRTVEKKNLTVSSTIPDYLAKFTKGEPDGNTIR